MHDRAFDQAFRLETNNLMVEGKKSLPPRAWLMYDITNKQTCTLQSGIHRKTNGLHSLYVNCGRDTALCSTNSNDCRPSANLVSWAGSATQTHDFHSTDTHATVVMFALTVKCCHIPVVASVAFCTTHMLCAAKLRHVALEHLQTFPTSHSCETNCPHMLHKASCVKHQNISV